MTREALKKGRTVQASQDGSREFISLLACILATGTAFPPTLIYKGRSYDLQNTWLDKFKVTDQAFFAASKNGWSSNAIGLQWLNKVFEHYTKKKASNRQWLLLVDKHLSYVNLKFLERANASHIIVLILPPHCTHQLQPLDVGFFGPLAAAYSKNLNILMHSSLGTVSMSKLMFWPMFCTAWIRSFTATNIQASIATSGIFPFNPEKVLSKIRRHYTISTPVSKKIMPLKTSITSRAICRVQRLYKENPTKRKLDIIFQANEKLAA